jgi:hypothetical protein
MTGHNILGLIGCILSGVTAPAIDVGIGTREAFGDRHQLMLEQQPSVYPDQGEIEGAKGYRVPRELLKNDPSESVPADEGMA